MIFILHLREKYEQDANIQILRFLLDSLNLYSRLAFFAFFNSFFLEQISALKYTSD